MKTIKFRAWDKKNKKMTFINDITFNIDDGSINQVSTGFMEHGENEDDPGNLEDVVLLQYTGQKDGNGKEIFEGDIVNLTYMNYAGDGNIDEHTEIIVIEDIKTLPFGETTIGCEIIGNKFEHPELLEGKNHEGN